MKALIFVFILSVVGGCKDPKKTGLEFLPNMVHSKAFEAYSENPLAPDKRTNMLPPKGSIAKGFLPHHLENTIESAEKAAIQLHNPFPATEENLARGKFIYQTYCLVCHGETGDGDGPLIPKFPSPPSYQSNRVKNYPAGRLFHIITMGSGQMPSHGAQILEKDRWMLVHYIQTLQKL